MTALIVIMGLAIGQPIPDPLGELRWERRPLVVFSPADSDPRWLQQVRWLEETVPELAERRILVIAVLGDRVELFDQQIELTPVAHELRQALDIEPGEFAIRLIGLDGGVKRAVAAPIETCRLFEQIDGMAMRRAELAREAGQWAASCEG